MSKKLLLEGITRCLFLELTATGLLLLGVWSLVFALGLKVLCRKFRLRAILPSALGMLLYTLFAIQSLSPAIFHALTPLVFMLLLSRMAPGFYLFQKVWTGFMAVISKTFGPINPLCLLDLKNAAFLKRGQNEPKECQEFSYKNR